MDEWVVGGVVGRRELEGGSYKSGKDATTVSLVRILFFAIFILRSGQNVIMICSSSASLFSFYAIHPG